VQAALLSENQNTDEELVQHQEMDVAYANRELTVLEIDKLYSPGAKGHNI
jgi:hypothetical protein